LVILSHAAAVNSFSIETDNELIMYRNIFKWKFYLIFHQTLIHWKSVQKNPNTRQYTYIRSGRILFKVYLVPKESSEWCVHVCEYMPTYAEYAEHIFTNQRKSIASFFTTVIERILNFICYRNGSC
jgi:hypothetical protein